LADNRVERRLAAILAADVAGYSRLMGADEEGALARLKAVRKSLIDPAITAHRGWMVKTTGDGMLVEFASAVDAARFAIEVQRGMAEQNAMVPQVNRIEFRIGIHVGDIIVDENDIFGDGVNIAARLEGIAEPGGVCISDDAQRQIRGKVDIAFEDMGPQHLKNIIEPMRAWRLAKSASASGATSTKVVVETTQALTLPDKPSIAVLPFQNMSGDPEQEYFTDGITEDIITALSKWRWFFVIARNSSFTYKGRAVDVKQVGRELGVRYLLEGSIRKAGHRIRLNAQLIDATSGVHIWAERFDRDFTDVFMVQDELTHHVAAAIEPALSKTEIEQARRKTPPQMAAWDHYLRGMWHYYQFTEEEVSNALASFKRAIDLDESFADAYAAMARALMGRMMYYALAEREAGIAEVLQVARKALSFDSQNINAYYILSIASSHSNDANAGLQFAQCAIQLNDNFAPGYFALAIACLYLGQPDDALTAIDQALRLNPNDPQTFTWRSTRASALYLLERYLEAIESARQSLALNRYHTAMRVLAASYAQLGVMDEARNAVRELLVYGQADKTIAAVIKPFMRAADRERWTEGLRAAGLPDA